ncbi:sporulation protein [Pontibacillus halophilus JSM 076056 = DSM 19796]|uniref:Sporulation protein n=1 Tax=Pontibacillus halophilus JSM 076056 = DSM 19796 TaxID=1385510 RepID=A0A0A5GLS1_9BACI|nr:germination protein YpeB [Pontibacillus halophilus]KGX92183.1 sporulation protein [Pontibacillus halophilus JSM 076056 = DSM 19796]
MLRWILIGVLALGVVGTGVWGYQEHQEKNAILIQAENTYQRAFHDLTYRTELLHDKIGTVMAMNSREQLSPQLAEVWRITSEAHTDVGQLPLTLMPFNKTQDFLTSIGEFSYKTAVRDLDKKPLSADEIGQLEKLYEQSGEIKDELRQVQYMVLEENLRWMDVELALASKDEVSDNKIIDGFKTVEKNVEGYEEGNLGPTATGTSQEEHGFSYLTGEDLSEEQAIEKAKNLFEVTNEERITIATSGKGADVPTYSVSYENGEKSGYMDLSVKGGHPINLLVERKVESKEISLFEGLEKAVAFLENQDYQDMEPFQSNQYGNIGVYSFLYKQGDVRIYPDSVQVKVALDNGDMLGLSARDFLMNHKERELPEPSLASDEAKQKVNKDVNIQEEYLSIIENDVNEEVLCYEYIGTMGENTYRIFINAESGAEERVDRLKQAEAKYEQTT